MHVLTPPLKTQGIKTKLVDFIMDSTEWDGKGRWIEPFLGSGVVLFNVVPARALASDSNTHIIDLYRAIQDGIITSSTIRKFLIREGKKLEDSPSYYYTVRDRFNLKHSPLDFLFLNRSCYNGVMRFNSHGRFNVPFCKRPARFSKAYISKITNQIAWLEEIMPRKRWSFRCMDWRKAVKKAVKGDFIYLDPPYLGTNSTYFNGWEENDLADLAKFLNKTKCAFAMSIWYKNMHRKNPDIRRYFSKFTILKHRHFYHVGPTENNRGGVIEALVTNSPRKHRASTRPRRH